MPIGLPANCIKMISNENETAKLPDGSKNLYKRNMIDRYTDRPAFKIIEN